MAGTASEANTLTVSDDPDYDTNMSGTAVEFNATELHCGSLDLSWAFDTLLRELLNGHPNDHIEFPLRALAEGLVELANDKGFAISDHTLFQVLQDLEGCIESYQKSMVDESWEFEVMKMVIGGSDVLIRVIMKRGYETYNGEEHRLALHLRMKPGRAPPLNRGLTFAVCSGCEIAEKSLYVTCSNDLERLLDSGEVTVSCILGLHFRASTASIVN
jgi:hypothetical protein